MKSRTIPIRRFTLLAVPCAALLAYVMTTVRSVHASFPGTNGQIAFTQGDPNNLAPTNSIFTINPDGSNPNPVPLPAGTGVEFFSVTAWSPDGSKLLISHTFRLDSSGNCCLFQPATVKPDGSDFNQLVPPTPPGGPSANGIDCPVWLLDQSRILCAFNDSTSGITGIFSILASDGSDPVRLTTNPYNSTDLPTDISPDGKRFVFVRYKPGASPAPRPFQTQQVALFVANIDGTGLRQITPYGVAAPHDLAWASWSPDGLNIIFAMRIQHSPLGGRLFIAHPDSESLTPINLQTGAALYFAFQPHWAPDGTRISFGMFINGGEGVYTANPDGSDVSQVTFTMDSTQLFNGPSWGTHAVAK